MNASILRHEIETLLGLTGAQAASFWRLATQAAASAANYNPYITVDYVEKARTSGFNAYPNFSGGVRVETHRPASRHVAATPPIPGGPVPVPYPNVAVPGAGKPFDGQYVVTQVQHRVGKDPYPTGGQNPGASGRQLVAGHKFTLDRHAEGELIRCVLAAAAGDLAAQRVQPLWTKTRLKARFPSAEARAAFCRALMQTLQQRGGRP